MGLLLLLTDLECILLLNPLEVSNLVISSLGLFIMLILVLLLNSPAVLVYSVLYLSFEMGL